jgi:arylsulfatase A-like enzyme
MRHHIRVAEQEADALGRQAELAMRDLPEHRLVPLAHRRAAGEQIDAAIGAVKSGDDAFRAITGWVESHGGWDDTAVIVTSDHGHMFVLEKPEAFAR